MTDTGIPFNRLLGANSAASNAVSAVSIFRMDQFQQFRPRKLRFVTENTGFRETRAKYHPVHIDDSDRIGAVLDGAQIESPGMTASSPTSQL